MIIICEVLWEEIFKSTLQSYTRYYYFYYNNNNYYY